MLSICSGVLMKLASRDRFYRIAWRSQDDLALHEYLECPETAILSSAFVTKLCRYFHNSRTLTTWFVYQRA